ncbi:MAG TPA: sulfite exporter TauE/SafE family protein [Acidimicrobiales bacterium]
MAASPPDDRRARPVPAARQWGRMALVGAAAGFLSGLFGVGGGVVIVPLLLLLAHASPKGATATSLGAIVPISLAGMAGYAVAGEVDWPVAGCLAAGAVAGAVVGTRLLVWISPPALQIAFAGVMLATAARMVAAEADPSGRGGLTLALAAGLVVLGLGSGVIAGLLGVGGGVVIVPGLTLLVGVPLVLAKGTSLAVIVPTALIGTFRNRRRGLTALRPAAVVGAGGVVSALAAARLSLRLDAGISRALFAALLVAVAARLVVLGVRGLRGAPAVPADRGP